jgi:general bacterial porin, GBP family
MKKSLIALAVLGAFSGAALAQSNVTMYGILDVNWQRIDPDVGDSQSGINGGHQSGNRFGVRGSEALGGGWNAIFTIEGGFFIDTGVPQQASAACGGVPVPPPGNLNPCGGATQSRLYGRQIWLGLQSNFGSLVGGRVALLSSGTGSFDMFGNIDPFVTGFGDSNMGRAFSSSNATRVDNAVLYKSPTWAGFTFGANYSFNVSGSEVAGSGNNVKQYGLAGSWGAGPFYAAITYDSFDIPGADAETHLQVGGTFDLKFVKLHAAYAKEEETRAFTTVGSPGLPSTIAGPDADSYMLGVTVPLFGGNVLASYLDRDGDPVTLASTAVDERDFSSWGIAYTYPLSRRTNLYAHYSDSDGEKTLNNSIVWDRKMITLGMRHLF